MVTTDTKLALDDITVEMVHGDGIDEKVIVEVADMYAFTFSQPPWNFTWIAYQDTPDDERSATHFVRTLVGYGSALFLARDPQGRLVGCLILLRLNEEALNGGILADLAEHSEAQPGEMYFAVFGILPEAQRIGLGETFMRRGLAWGGDQVRYHLRTQEGAKGMVRLSENVAGMRIHKTREVTQGGSTYVRRYYVRDKNGEPA